MQNYFQISDNQLFLFILNVLFYITYWFIIALFQYIDYHIICGIICAVKCYLFMYLEDMKTNCLLNSDIFWVFTTHNVK